LGYVIAGGWGGGEKLGRAGTVELLYYDTIITAGWRTRGKTTRI
jgi:hypothetical protein